MCRLVPFDQHDHAEEWEEKRCRGEAEKPLRDDEKENGDGREKRHPDNCKNPPGKDPGRNRAVHPAIFSACGLPV